MAEPQQDLPPEGEYVIVSFELQGSEEEWEEELATEGDEPSAGQISAAEDVAEAFQNLVYYPVDWNYQTEKEAWAALHQMVAEGVLPAGEYGVIKLCISEEIVSVEEAASARREP